MNAAQPSTQEKIFALAETLTKAKARKDKLKELSTENQEVIDKTEIELAQLMIDEEMQNFKKNGVVYYLTTKMNCNAVKEKQEELFATLREHGAEDLIQEAVNGNRLKSWVKELMTENDDELPEYLVGKVNVYERSVCGTRKG